MIVSVVIPTCNRRDLLEKCLHRLCQQDIDPDMFEVIISDDENSVLTEELVLRFTRDNPSHNFVYTRIRPKRGPAAARNAGWRKARGEIVAFTDDDCLPPSNWLSTGLSGFDDGIDAIWGKVIVPLPKHPTDYQLNTAGLGNGGFVTANCFCRKSILERVGGFDERFERAWREDSDLYFTLLERSASLQYIPEVVMFHPARKASFGKSIFMQKNNLFEPLLYKKHPELYKRYIYFPILKLFYAIVILIACMVVCALIHWIYVGLTAFFCWIILTAQFVRDRLLYTSHDTKHVLEMIITSICIPPLAIYWRMVGRFRFKNV